MGPQAHKLHHRRTTVKRLWRNYEDLPKFSGKSIEKTAINFAPSKLHFFNFNILIIFILPEFFIILNLIFHLFELSPLIPVHFRIFIPRQMAGGR